MKIALIGTSPSSRHLAPFDDPSWMIWGTGPGNLNPESKMRRCDAFFEIHPWDKIAPEPSYAPYVMALRDVPIVYTQKPEPLLPNSIAYPLDEMVEKYGPYFFTSSFSYMMALAIKMLTTSSDEEKIMGFWGVDMSATEEYGQQRPGGWFFFMKAREAGIKIILPPESDMLMPPGLYGYVENSPWFRKMTARQREYQAYHGQALTEARIAQEKSLRMMGNLDTIQYDLNTWGHLAYEAFMNKMGVSPEPENANGASDHKPGE